MKLNLIGSSSLEKKVKVFISSEELEQEITNNLSQRKKKTSIPGFRVGNVPDALIRRNYYELELENYIKKQVPVIIIKKIFNEYKFTILEKPRIAIVKFSKEQGVVLEIDIKIMPDIPKIKWSLILLNKFEIEPTEDDILSAKKNFLREFVEYKEIVGDYVIKNGDKIIIDYYGKINNKDFDGNKGNNIELKVGSNLLLNDLEKGCIGMILGQEKYIKVAFPNDYIKKELSGSIAYFKVKVRRVFKAVIEDKLTNNVLEKFKFKNEEEMEKVLKKKIKFDFIGIIRDKMKRDLFDILDKEYIFDLPSSFVNEDYNSRWKEFLQNAEKENIFKNKNESQIRNCFLKESMKRVKILLIITKISRDYNIFVTDNDIQLLVEKQAKNNPKFSNEILQFYKNKKNFDKMKPVLIEEKSIDLIFNKIKIISRKISSKDFLKVINK